MQSPSTSAGVGDQVLLHSVAPDGQRLHVLGQRGRARCALLHQNRDLHLSTVHIVRHIEHEVIRSRGLDHDGNGPNLYRRRRWII